MRLEKFGQVGVKVNSESLVTIQVEYSLFGSLFRMWRVNSVWVRHQGLNLVKGNQEDAVWSWLVTLGYGQAGWSCKEEGSHDHAPRLIPSLIQRSLRRTNQSTALFELKWASLAHPISTHHSDYNKTNSSSPSIPLKLFLSIRYRFMSLQECKTYIKTLMGVCNSLKRVWGFSHLLHNYKSVFLIRFP